MNKTLLMSYDFYRYGHGQKYALTLTSNDSKLFQVNFIGFLIQKIEKFRNFKPLYKIIRAFVNLVFFFFGVLYYLVKNKSYTKIHFLDGEYLLIGLLSKFLRAKSIITLHNPSIFTKSNSYSKLISKLYKSLNCTFIVHGEYSKSVVKDYLNGEIVSINYPVSTVNEKKYHNSLKRRKYVSLIGVLRRDKNIFKLIEIFSQLYKYEPTLQFLIAGYPLEYSKEEIRNYISKFKGLENNITLILKYLSNEDYESYLTKTKVLINTYSSDFVSASGPVADAIGYGIPVVVRDIGQVGELVKQHNLGKVIRKFNPESYKDAVLDLLDESKYMSYSENAFSFSKENNWENFKDKHMNIYSK